MRTLIFLLVLAIGSMLLLLDQTERHAPTGEGIAAGPVNPGLLVQLRAAVHMAAATAECGYTSTGYGHNTPRQAARELVELQNSAAEPAPGEPKLPGMGIEFTTDPPTRVWQVQVDGDDRAGTLTLRGYATDLSTPYVAQELPCG